MKNFAVLMAAFLIIGMMLSVNAVEAQMKTKTVTLYSSVGFIAKEAALKTQKGNQSIEFFVPTQTDNESIVIIDSGAAIKQYKVNETWEKETILQKMVAANKGKQVVLITEFFKIKGAIGEIYRNQYVEISSPVLLDSNISISSQQPLLVPVDSIRAMSLAQKAEIKTEEQAMQKKVSVLESVTNENRAIKALYFVSGASWNPSYQLFWESDTKGTLYYYAKATNNTNEDWNSVQLQIVAGQPNMKYYPIYNSYAYDTAYEKSAGGGMAAPSAMPNQFVSGEEQEYHVYGAVDGITIEKNSEAVIPVLSKQVNYEKEYEWFAGDAQVKYNIRILNTTGEPLAAGFFSAYSNNRYVGGNYIKWTAEDDNAVIFLSPALDIIAKKTMETKEITSTGVTAPSPVVITTYYNGKLHLENHKSTSAKMKITDSMPSDAENFQGSIKPDKIENNQMEWAIMLKAGEKKDITYSYETKYYKGY